MPLAPSRLVLNNAPMCLAVPNTPLEPIKVPEFLTAQKGPQAPKHVVTSNKLYMCQAPPTLWVPDTCLVPSNAPDTRTAPSNMLDTCLALSTLVVLDTSPAPLTQCVLDTCLVHHTQLAPDTCPAPMAPMASDTRPAPCTQSVPNTCPVSPLKQGSQAPIKRYSWRH